MRRQDLAVLVFYYCGVTKFRNALLRRRGEPSTRFVTFHSTPSRDSRGFMALLGELRRSTNVVTMDDYFAGRLRCDKTNVVITFDDGYKNWMTVALPALERFQLPATFFISSGLLEPLHDTAGYGYVRCEAEAGEGALTEHDVRQMSRRGFTIGGHTVHHVNLSSLRDRRAVAAEIVLDRQRLEWITGAEVRYFAYPFGACRNDRVDLVAELKEAGYRGAVTTLPGLNGPRSDAYRLRRELTGVPMSVPVFAARVGGAFDLVWFVRRRLSALFAPGAVA